jgi:hypothetical protein
MARAVRARRRVAPLLSALALALTALAVLAASALATPQFGSGVSAERNADGRLELFASDFDGDMVHMWQLSTGGWSAWNPMPGGGSFALARPAVGRNADGRLEVFAQSGARMYHNYQLAPGSGWSGWVDFGGSFTSSVFTRAVAANTADGRIDVFAVNSAGHLAHRWQLGSGTWSAWTDLGGSFNGSAVPGVTLTYDGRLDVYMFDTNGAVVHKAQTAANGSTWSSWSSLGGDFVDGAHAGPAVARNKDGRLEVFATATVGRELFHRYQTSPGGSWNNRWVSLGGFVEKPVVARNADGRLEVFAANNNGPQQSTYPKLIHHIWQVAPNGGWSAWDYLSGGGPGTYNQPTVATNKDGRLELFMQLYTGDTIYHSWQSAPSSLSWSGYNPLG